MVVVVSSCTSSSFVGRNDTTTATQVSSHPEGIVEKKKKML